MLRFWEMDLVMGQEGGIMESMADGEENFFFLFSTYDDNSSSS